VKDVEVKHQNKDLNSDAFVC